MNPYAIEFYTDGSSKVAMGFNAGCAAVIVYPEHASQKSEKLDWSYDKAKIGAMEIGGINRSLEWLTKNLSRLRELNVNTAIIHCDNQNVVDCANKHVYSWTDNAWKKRDGGSIANLNSWKKYISLRRKLQSSGIFVEIQWIRGKSTDETKKVDKLAKGAADKSPRYVNTDYIHQKVSNTLTEDKFALEKFNKSGEIPFLIRIYYHQPVNRTKNSDVEIRFEIIEGEEVTGRYSAYSSLPFNAKYIRRKNYYNAVFYVSVKNRPLFKSVENISGRELDELKIIMKKKYGRC